jgi:cytochrome oxidase Cu insertion factor (SCO1/SenC/PrrC family)
MNRYPAQDLEPAVRDPKKLRLTGIILVVLMLVSGFGILIAYNRSAKRQAGDDRPALGQGRLDKNFRVWRQDESEAGLLDLEGDVFVISPVSFEQEEGWKNTRKVLENLKGRYGERDDFHIVMLTVDPENEPPTKLAGHAKDLGAELPFWWLAGASEESTHKFLKRRLKAQLVPQNKDGEWEYDPSLIVIDRDRHLRQATVRARNAAGKELNFRNPVPFDFEEAAKWDAEGRSEGLEESNVETLEGLLYKTIDHLLEQPVAKKS